MEDPNIFLEHYLAVVALRKLISNTRCLMSQRKAILRWACMSQECIIAIAMSKLSKGPIPFEPMSSPRARAEIASRVSQLRPEEQLQHYLSASKALSTEIEHAEDKLRAYAAEKHEVMQLMAQLDSKIALAKKRKEKADNDAKKRNLPSGTKPEGFQLPPNASDAQKLIAKARRAKQAMENKAVEVENALKSMESDIIAALADMKVAEDTTNLARMAINDTEIQDKDLREQLKQTENKLLTVREKLQASKKELEMTEEVIKKLRKDVDAKLENIKDARTRITVSISSQKMSRETVSNSRNKMRKIFAEAEHAKRNLVFYSHDVAAIREVMDKMKADIQELQKGNEVLDKKAIECNKTAKASKEDETKAKEFLEKTEEYLNKVIAIQTKFTAEVTQAMSQSAPSLKVFQLLRAFEQSIAEVNAKGKATIAPPKDENEKPNSSKSVSKKKASNDQCTII